METNKLKSVEEFRKLRARRNVNVLHRERLSSMQRAALWITNHVGTMGFFLIIFGWTFVWLLFNTIAPASARFDPAPAFVMWLFISNLIQIFLMPLIMIGQNLQSAHAEARAEEDFEVNKKAEEEIETVLLHLENQNRLILEILERLDKEKKLSSSTAK